MVRLPLPALLMLALALSLASCGDEEEPETTDAAATTAPPTTTTQTAEDEPGGQDDASPSKPKPNGPPTGPAEGPEGDPRPTALERAAARAVRGYVEAIDQRDGPLVCARLAPGAIEEVELPRKRGGCAESVSASIGYEDPRGIPVWKSSQLLEVLSVELSGETAKVVATVVTEFADRDEPSIEDDVVYLTRDGAGWLIAKPSSTLYRAVGIADIPPTVLSPP